MYREIRAMQRRLNLAALSQILRLPSYRDLQRYRPVLPRHTQPSDMSLSHRLLLSYALCSLLIALSLYLLGGYHSGFHTLNGWGAVIPKDVWAAITTLGDTRVALAVLLFYIYRHPQLLAATLLASIPTTLVVQVAKRGFPLPRPSGVLEGDSFIQIGQVLKMGSFPSGHSATAAVLVTLILLVTTGRSTKLLLLVAMFLMAVSRVAVGAHWPVDILVGSAVGVFCALFGYHMSIRQRWCRLSVSQWCVVSLLVYAAVSLFAEDSGYPSVHWFTVLIGVTGLAAYALQLSGLRYRHGRRWLLATLNPGNQ